MSVTRYTLYAEVWAEPMTTVATRYGVSSNYLARICERLGIPRPARGYWQQLAVGRPPSIPPLPEPDPGDEVAWHRHVRPYALWPPPPEFTPITQRGSRRGAPLKTHPILVGVRESFEDVRPKRAFLDDGYLRPKAHVLPDVRVSKDALGTALKIANRLYLALEDQGHWVRLAPQAVRYERGSVDRRERPTSHYDRYNDQNWHPSIPTLAFVGGVAIGLTLFEISEEMDANCEDGQWVRAPRRTTEAMRRARPWDTPSRHHLPSGRLAVHAYSAYGWADWSNCWRESKAGELADFYGEIAMEFERAAPVIVTLYAEAERRHVAAAQMGSRAA